MSEIVELWEEMGEKDFLGTGEIVTLIFNARSRVRILREEVEELLGSDDMRSIDGFESLISEAENKRGQIQELHDLARKALEILEETAKCLEETVNPHANGIKRSTNVLKFCLQSIEKSRSLVESEVERSGALHPRYFAS